MVAITTAVDRIASMNSRIRVIRGGTYAGKTYAILLILLQLAMDERYRITVVAESIPAVKQGALYMFRQIMESLKLWNDSRFNATDRIKYFTSGSTIQFTSFDTVSKAKAAGKRDILFLNEVNHIPKDIAVELISRTDRLILADYNPSTESWVDTELATFPDASMITLTYRDNESLSQQKIAELEYKRELAKTSEYWDNWCTVYLDGLPGKLLNAVISNWNIIHCLPDEAVLVRHGLDFGFSNDPMAGVSIYRWNGKLVARQWLYRTHVGIAELVSIIRQQKQAEVICDSASPMIIAELQRAGIRAVPCKGKDVKGELAKLNEVELLVLADSTDLIRELRGYVWEGAEPKGEDHLIDALRYAYNYQQKKIRGTVV